MSDSEFMRSFRLRMLDSKTIIRQCAVRPGMETWTMEGTRPIRLVLLKFSEQSYVVMLCDAAWMPVQLRLGGESSIREFASVGAANLWLEHVAVLCQQLGWEVYEQVSVRYTVHNPGGTVVIKMDGDGYE